jgi:hypothetical protein
MSFNWLRPIRTGDSANVIVRSNADPDIRTVISVGM